MPDGRLVFASGMVAACLSLCRVSLGTYHAVLPMAWGRGRLVVLTLGRRLCRLLGAGCRGYGRFGPIRIAGLIMFLHRTARQRQKGCPKVSPASGVEQGYP